MTEEHYLTALAHWLGTSFEQFDRIARADCPLSDDQLIDADAAGLLPLFHNGKLTWIIVPARPYRPPPVRNAAATAIVAKSISPDLAATSAAIRRTACPPRDRAAHDRRPSPNPPPFIERAAPDRKADCTTAGWPLTAFALFAAAPLPVIESLSGLFCFVRYSWPPPCCGFYAPASANDLRRSRDPSPTRSCQSTRSLGGLASVCRPVVCVSMVGFSRSAAAPDKEGQCDPEKRGVPSLVFRCRQRPSRSPRNLARRVGDLNRRLARSMPLDSSLAFPLRTNHLLVASQAVSLASFSSRLSLSAASWSLGVPGSSTSSSSPMPATNAPLRAKTYSAFARSRPS